MGVMLWDNLGDYVHDWMKGLQQIADSIAPDPGADNSMFNLTSLPYRFDSTCYGTVKTEWIKDGYAIATKGYGQQPWLFAFRLNLYNNTLKAMNCTFLGKAGSGSIWNSLTSSDIDAITAAGEELYSGDAIQVLNSYPTQEIQTSCNNSAEVYFIPALHDDSSIRYKFPKWDSTDFTTSKCKCMFKYVDSIYYDSNAGCWKPNNLNDIVYMQVDGVCSTYHTTTIAVFPDTYSAEYLKNRISQTSAHNAVINYSKSGHQYRLYYGDNYLIYGLLSGNVYNYDDFYQATSQATAAISGWFPADPPLVTPTYDEVKHEDDPGIDEDIEVDMPLNDAAYGAGLSHYYVTTVGSTVLEDISAAMSTWDIVNTGKDLYKNLISCRITKVGPIPSEPGTFVIYGEELQYNGSPITITKITGNPSMDLGEYEILPKFHDFRDYAPFTKIEMFIPYCGWVSLPSHCMSSEEDPKIITGTLLCDIIAGTCKAVIKCNDTVVAEASGFTAIDVPFTGENVGMKMAGIASSITSYGNQAAKTVGSVASGGMAGGAGAGAALAGGIVGMLGSYAQMYSAFNANYTEICGKTGDGCNVAGLGSVYIKIQRPKAGETEAPYYVPANYAHTSGFMSMKQKAISECNGLIVCANVDTSGISGATARERAEIKRLLETGIYVNLTPPEPPEP